jgi:hypothetical protein
MNIITMTDPYPMLHPEYLRYWKPVPRHRPAVDLTEQTLVLIQERADDPNPVCSFGDFHTRVQELGYSGMDACDIDAKGRALCASGLSLYTAEGRAVVANPTDEEWEAQEFVRQAEYAARVSDALEAAHAAAWSFQTLSVQQMALQYLRQPDPEIWNAITALVPESDLEEATFLGECQQEDEDEVWERREREQLCY